MALSIGPFWEPPLRAALKRYLDLDIDPPTVVGWGVLLVALGLLYHLFAFRADGLRTQLQTTRIREHDKPLLEAFQTDFPEDRIDFILEGLASDHAVFFEHDQFLGRARSRLQSSNFHILDEVLRTKAQRLLDDLERVDRFIAREFFVPVNATSANRTCLRPDWNFDRCGSGMPSREEEICPSSNDLRLLGLPKIGVSGSVCGLI
ncbi:hypothetical protein, partial [Mycoplana ramosa]